MQALAAAAPIRRFSAISEEGPVGDVGLEAGALDGVGAAVRPLQDAPVHELAQVTPYRLGRHPRSTASLPTSGPPSAGSGRIWS